MAIIQDSGGEGVDARSRVPHRSPGEEVRLPRNGNYCCNSVRGSRSRLFAIGELGRGEEPEKILLAEGPHSQIAEDP